MKSYYVSDLLSGQELVNEPFLLQEVTRRKTKDERPYLLCVLRDKTGPVNGIFWNVPDYVDEWAQAGLVVYVSGKANHYKDSIQISITDLNPSAAPDMTDFLASSKRDREEMIAELKQHVQNLAQPWQTLAHLLLLEEPFLTLFANAPAARGMHHAFIGGLIEHTLSMARLAEFMAGFYPYVDKDLLLTGTLLHDMGKAREYTIDTSFGFSEDGRLVGHIVRAIIMVETTARELGFPESQVRDLVHLIASHHGKLEWGSPVQPKTLEAVLLHQIDLLDSRVQGFLEHIGNDPSGGEWTLKPSAMFNTELRRPEDFRG